MGKNINGTNTADSSGVCEKLFSAITASPAFQTIRRLSSPARDRSPLANLNHAAGKKVVDIQSKPQQPNKSGNQVIHVPIKFEKTEVQQPASTPYENGGKLLASHKAAAKIEPEPAQVARKKVIAIEHITYGQEGNKEKQKSKAEPSLVKGAAKGQNINAAMEVEKAQQVQVKNEGKKHAGGVDINDKFSEYINRTKIKIRTMSSKKIQDSDHEGNDGGKDVQFSNFIDRAKNKFKSSTSTVGGTGNTVSFKRDQ